MNQYYHSLLALSLLTFISASHAAQSKLVDPPPLARIYCLTHFEDKHELFSVQIPPESSHQVLRQAIIDYIKRDPKANNDTMKLVDPIQFQGKIIKSKQDVATVIASSQTIDPKQIEVIISEKQPKVFIRPFSWAEKRTVCLDDQICNQATEHLENTVKCEITRYGITTKPAKK